jgi:hypothetical protein
MNVDYANEKNNLGSTYPNISNVVFPLQIYLAEIQSEHLYTCV